MKKFLRKTGVIAAGLLFIIAFPFLLVCSYDNADHQTTQNHNIISLQTKSAYDSLDVLFVGNSYAYSGINTHYLDSLGISSFNLGIATAGVEFYALITNDYFDHTYKAPEKVFILVSPMIFSSKADNYISYPIHRYLEDPVSNISIAWRYRKADLLIPMYQKSYRKGIAHITSKGAEVIPDRTNNKGYAPNTTVVDSAIIARDEHLYYDFRNESFPEVQIDKLLALASSIQKNGSELVFFELPTNRLYDYFNEDYLADYNKGLGRIKQEYALFELNEDLFTSDNFRNIDHLNSSGAEISTRELAGWLAKQEHLE